MLLAASRLPPLLPPLPAPSPEPPTPQTTKRPPPRPRPAPIPSGTATGASRGARRRRTRARHRAAHDEGSCVSLRALLGSVAVALLYGRELARCLHSPLPPGAASRALRAVRTPRWARVLGLPRFARRRAAVGLPRGFGTPRSSRPRRPPPGHIGSLPPGEALRTGPPLLRGPDPSWPLPMPRWSLGCAPRRSPPPPHPSAPLSAGGPREGGQPTWLPRSHGPTGESGARRPTSHRGPRARRSTAAPS